MFSLKKIKKLNFDKKIIIQFFYTWYTMKLKKVNEL